MMVRVWGSFRGGEAIESATPENACQGRERSSTDVHECKEFMHD